MSFLTGTQTELLYVSKVAGTTLATFTTEDNLMKTLPVCRIPAGYFGTRFSNGEGGALKILAHGRLGTTGAPTFTFSLRFLTSSTWSAAGIAFSTAALTAGTTQTLAPFRITIDFVFRTMGIGAASTIAIMGAIESPLGLASPMAGTFPANNTAFTNATWNDQVDNYMFLSAACGTSNALNLVGLEIIKVYGEN